MKRGKYIRTVKHKKEMSRTLAGKMVGIKNPFYGKKHSDVTKEKLSKSHRGTITWNKGIPCSNEMKLELSKKLTGNKNALGAKRSRVTRDKLSKARLGKKFKPLSEEHRRKISKSNKGRIISKEVRIKISKHNKGLLVGGKNPRWKGGKQECYRRNRENISWKLKKNTRSLVYSRLKKRLIDKKNSTFNLLGFTVDDLIEHLESRFCKGMSWDNYGKWHIDHIRPDSSFNYTSAEDKEFQECWSLSNLQPLWAKDNLIKGKKI